MESKIKSFLTTANPNAVFLSFYNVFFFTQPTFVFHLQGDFYVIHAHIVSFLIDFNIFHALFCDLFCSFILFYILFLPYSFKVCVMTTFKFSKQNSIRRTKCSKQHQFFLFLLTCVTHGTPSHAIGHHIINTYLRKQRIFLGVESILNKCLCQNTQLVATKRRQSVGSKYVLKSFMEDIYQSPTCF